MNYINANCAVRFHRLAVLSRRSGVEMVPSEELLGPPGSQKGPSVNFQADIV